jgi:hypothetical protein
MQQRNLSKDALEKGFPEDEEVARPMKLYPQKDL